MSPEVDQAAAVHPAAAAAMAPSKVCTFASIEQLNRIVAQAVFPMEVMQLSPGQLRGRLVTIDCYPLGLVLIQANLPLLSRGHKPMRWLQCGLNMAPIPAGPVELQSHGEAAGESDLFGLKPHTESYLISPAGFHTIFLSLPRDQFFEMAEGHGLPDLEKPLIHTNKLTIEPSRLSDLRTLLRQVVQLAIHQPHALTMASTRETVLSNLIAVLQEALVDGLERRRGMRSSSAPRIDLVKQMHAWLRKNPTREICLDDLCRELHSSRRTLIRGVREHLNMGPMQFLKLYRLHAVHRELQHANSEFAQVGGLAGLWGFHSAGHFARDYQLLFGERPSDTLRRRR